MFATLIRQAGRKPSIHHFFVQNKIIQTVNFRRVFFRRQVDATQLGVAPRLACLTAVQHVHRAFRCVRAISYQRTFLRITNSYLRGISS